MKQTTWMAWAACAAMTATATPLWAQDDTEETGDDVGDEDVTLEEDPEQPADEEPVAEQEPAPAEADATADATADAERGESAVELPGETYRFIGARYRGIIVPKFMINLFAEGGKTVFVHAFGPEFAIRKDGFEYNLGAWLGLYNMDPVALKGKDDPTAAWETVSSEIKVLYLTSDFLWSHEFSPEFALNYGVGAGFGIVFGDLHRNQTRPESAADIGDPDSWVNCTGPDDPLGTVDGVDYCDTDNEHYGDYTEPSWANGGSKPLLFPWLALQTGLRYKASRRFVARLDLGFGTSGFFFGLGADYGL